MDSYDDQRRFQRIPIQKPSKAKDKAHKVMQQAQADCMRIPTNVVRQARVEVQEDGTMNPIGVFKNLVSKVFR